MTLDWPAVIDLVHSLDLPVESVILTGSVPLLAHGAISQVGDVDLVATGSAWDALAQRGPERDGELGDRVIDLPGGIQAFSGWHGQSADAVAARASQVDGLWVASIADVVAYKRRLGRPKDVEHLAALERWADEMTDAGATIDRDQAPLRDRADAGTRLAPVVAALAPADPIVLALPRGGVPVAAPVARALGCPLDVLVVRKLGLPTNPEYAFGAIGEGGEPWIDDRIVAAADLLREEVDAVVEKERAALASKIALYREGQPALSLDGATAIVVDDGAATGSTALAAIAVARSMGAAHVIVAVGAAPPDVLAMLSRHADRGLAAITPEPFLSVGQWYEDFTQTADDEVLAALRQ
ncbi:phosphoribosyltransferase [Demequina activiva]|nr:phosphoribosyltransferase family protein [Demequina activiva]